MRLATIGAAAFFALVVLPRATLPMADGDAWWHIHAGEDILATGQVADTNTWTLAGEGFRWVSQDWLSNVAMALLFNAGEWGVAWLSLAFAAIVAVAFAMLWAAIGWRSSTGWLGRLLWLTAGLIVAGPIIGIRVQTVDLLLTAATVWILWSYLADPRPWRPFLLAVVAFAWVNLHAGWVMLFLLGGAVLVGEWLDGRTGRRFERPPLSTAALGLLAAGLGAALLVLAINPNGPAIYAYPFATASIDAHRDFLVEWSPPNLASFEGQAAIGFIALVVLPTIAFSWRQLRSVDLLWLVGLSIITLGAVRFSLFLGPIGSAIAAIHLAPLVSDSRTGRALEPILRKWKHGPDTPLLRAVNLLLLTVVLVLGGALAVARAAPSSQASAIVDAVPVDAARRLDDNAPNARVFNTYSWGGYLARRLPAARIYIDGRSDIYGDEVIQRYAATLNVSTNPASLLDAAEIDVALLKPDAPLTEWLDESDEWQRRYEDERSILWMRRSG